jgi:hypothetical protein
MFGFDLGDCLLLGVVGVVRVLVLDFVLGLLDDPVTAVVIGDTVDADDPMMKTTAAQPPLPPPSIAIVIPPPPLSPTLL